MRCQSWRVDYFRCGLLLPEWCYGGAYWLFLWGSFFEFFEFGERVNGGHLGAAAVAVFVEVARCDDGWGIS